MNIRLANLTDVPAIMHLIAGVVPDMNAAGNFQWDSTYPNPAVFEKDIALNQLWLADIDGDIAGVAAITTDQEPEYAALGWDINEPAIVTHRLAVSVNHQGKGIAAALLQQADEVARSRGISKLRIDTNTQNRPLKSFFQNWATPMWAKLDLVLGPTCAFTVTRK